MPISTTISVLDASIPVTLPHQREGNRNLVIPKRFRIVATLNSFDRQFVNNLSQAIRRRFLSSYFHSEPVHLEPTDSAS